MKSIACYINEGLLKGIADTLNSGDDAIKSIYIEDFINKIYFGKNKKYKKSKINMTISDKPNNKGLYEVVIHESITLKDKWQTEDGQNVTSLTNDCFVIKKVEGDYIIPTVTLDSLEGCPEIVEGDCMFGTESYRGHITSLKGCPKKVGGTFSFSLLHLESLNHLPEIGKDLLCNGCDIKSLKGCPKHIKGYFKCSYNMNLKSLEGCPEVVHGDFIKNDCGKRFTAKYVEKYCKVLGIIM